MKLFCVSRAVKHLLDPLLHLGIIIMVIVLMTMTIVTILIKGARTRYIKKKPAQKTRSGSQFI